MFRLMAFSTAIAAGIVTIVAASVAPDEKADGVYIGRAAGEDSARVAVVVGGGRFVAYACSAEQNFNEAYSRWFEGAVGEDGAISADAGNLKLNATLKDGRVVGDLGGEFAKTQTFTAAKVAESASAGLYRLSKLEDDAAEVFGWIADQEGNVVGSARRVKPKPSVAASAKIAALKAKGGVKGPSSGKASVLKAGAGKTGVKTNPSRSLGAKSKQIRTLPSGKKKVPQELTASEGGSGTTKKNGTGEKVGQKGKAKAAGVAGKGKQKGKAGEVAQNGQNGDDAGSEQGEAANKNKKKNKNAVANQGADAAEAAADEAEDAAAIAAAKAAKRAARAAGAAQAAVAAGAAAEAAEDAAEAAEENAARGQKISPKNLVRKKAKAADVLPGEEMEAALVGVDEEERVLTVDDGEEVKEIAIGDRQTIVSDADGNKLIEDSANAKGEKKLAGGVASMLKKMAKGGETVVRMKMGANSVVVKPAE